MTALLLAGCGGGSGNGEETERADERLEVTSRPSERARSEIPPGRLDAYLETGREVELDWAVIAAVSAIETGHRAGGAPIEDALAIGYALRSAGAADGYRAALASRGGTAFSRRALRIAESYRGEAIGAPEPPAETGPLEPPVDGEVRAGFGTLYGRPHLGIDYDARTATEVTAGAAGVVTEVGSAPAYGRYVCLLHRFPRALRGRESLTTCYGYLGEAGVRPGDVVERGETVGLSGCSGQVCVSPRVHFMVRAGERPDAVPVDPAPFLGRRGRP